MSNSVRPHRRQPTRLPHPWDSPGKNMEWVAISFSSAWKWKVKVKSLSHVRLLQHHGLQPTRLLCPWDFPGKSTGVGCHGMVLGVLISYFICSCPFFPAALIEENIFAPLYILISFVKNKVYIGVWVYLWTFYLLPLVCVSMFVPVPYHLDEYNFVV